MKSIRITEFINRMSISRDESWARGWLVEQGFEVSSRRAGDETIHCVSAETFKAIVNMKADEIENEISHKQRALANLRSLESCILTKTESGKQ